MARSLLDGACGELEKKRICAVARAEASHSPVRPGCGISVYLFCLCFRQRPPGQSEGRVEASARSFDSVDLHTQDASFSSITRLVGDVEEAVTESGSVGCRQGTAVELLVDSSGNAGEPAERRCNAKDARQASSSIFHDEKIACITVSEVDDGRETGCCDGGSRKHPSKCRRRARN